jgi:hypothetical protein
MTVNIRNKTTAGQGATTPKGAYGARRRVTAGA